MYVAKVLDSEISNWYFGDQIFLEAPTGCGKTTFVCEVLREHAVNTFKKPILYLCSRKALCNQIKNFIGEKFMELHPQDIEEVGEELDWFYVTTYHHLQKKFADSAPEKRRWFSLSKYSYVICDEFHYIVQDSIFNNEIIHLLDFFKYYVGLSSRVPRMIFISATMGNAMNVYLNYLNIKHVCSEYQQIANNCRFAKSGHVWHYLLNLREIKYKLFFYKKITDIASLITLSEDEKWLIFISNKEKYKTELEPMLEIKHIKYQYIDADNIKNDDTEYKSILEQEKFQAQVLITTKILDVGINFKDDKLRNIVVMSYDKTEILQMIGRKRGETEGVKVYVQTRNGQYFRRVLDFVNDYLRLAEEKPDKVWEMYQRKPELAEPIKKLFIVNKEGYFEKNPLYLAKLKEQAFFLSTLMEEAEQNQITIEKVFQRHVKEWLGNSEINEIEPDFEIKKLTDEEFRSKLLLHFSGYLDKNVQKELCEQIREYIVKNNIKNRDFRISRNMGMNRINSFFRVREFELELHAKRMRKNGVQQTYWEILDERK